MAAQRNDHNRPSLRRAVVALESRDFRLFYAALMVAGMGGQIQSMANIVQIYEMTGSALHLGLTGLARAIPIIALSLVGGVVADRVDRIRFIIVTQALVGLLALGLAALTAGGVVEVWHIYLVTFLASALTSVAAPARSAILPNLVPRHHLLNAIALNATVWQASNIVGPAIAGVSIAAFGFAWTYLINGVLNLVTLVALALMRMRPITARSRDGAWKSMTVGFSFVRSRSIILVLLATDMAAMAFGSFRILLPIFGERLEIGTQALGLLFAAPGVGSLVGAVLIMSLGDFRYKGLVVGAGIMGYCLALVVLAVSPWYLVVILAAAATGFFDSIQSTPRNGIIQIITPDELRGRVASFQHMLAGGTPALGQVLSGGVAALFGAPITVVAGAAVCAALVIGMFATRPELRVAEVGAEHTPADSEREPVRG